MVLEGLIQCLLMY